MFGISTKKTGTLSMQEAKQELAKDGSIILLDVRDTDEYREGHIQGSINIPLHILPAVLPQKLTDKNARIFVYCLSGARSAQASRWLRQNGYENVVNIGGIYSWSGPVVRG
jgi:phage shock protein E